MSGIGQITQPLRSMAEYFTVTLDKVSTVNLQIALAFDCPEWMKGVYRDADLPKIGRGPLAYSFWAPNSEKSIAEVVGWFIQYGEGEWYLYGNHISFSNEVDAVTYQMKYL